MAYNKIQGFPSHGGDINSWDTDPTVGLNTSITALDTALGGLTSLSLTGASGTYVLSLAQYTPPNIELSGTLSANVNIQVPATVGGTWSIYNGTTGAFSVTFGVTGGNSLTVPAGYRVLIISDGTNVAWAAGSIPNPATLGGTGNLIFAGTNGYIQGNSNFTLNGSGTLLTALAVTVTGATTLATLSVSSTISGAGVTALFASPPAIGGTAAASGKFTQAYTAPNALGNINSSLNPACGLSNVFTATLTGNPTFAPTGQASGQTINMLLTQDATGSRTVTWGSSVKWANGSAGALSTTANAVDLVILTYLGTTWYGSVAKAFS